MKNIADIRKEYTMGELDPNTLGSDPLLVFSTWFDQALASQVTEVNAMVLGTVNAEGRPSSRLEERRVGKECLRQCRSRWSAYH